MTRMPALSAHPSPRLRAAPEDPRDRDHEAHEPVRVESGFAETPLPFAGGPPALNRVPWRRPPPPGTTYR